MESMNKRLLSALPLLAALLLTACTIRLMP